jgi:hypothetical protein
MPGDYYYSLVVLLVLFLIHLAVHCPVPAQFLFHLYGYYQGKCCVQLLQCLEGPKSMFSACSLYLLHYIWSHHLCLDKDLYKSRLVF